MNENEARKLQSLVNRCSAEVASRYKAEREEVAGETWVHLAEAGNAAQLIEMDQNEAHKYLIDFGTSYAKRELSRRSKDAATKGALRKRTRLYYG